MDNLNIPKSTPRDFFMYLLVTGTLYASIISFLAMLFAYVDVGYPDKLYNCYDCVLTQIRWSSSILIIVFPVFIVLFWLLSREYVRAPEKREIKVRRWLGYFTLFLSAVVIITDLITLVYNFYNGDLTTAFALKVLGVLIVAAAVFGFYLKDLRGIGFTNQGRKLIAGLAVLVVFSAIIGGFFLVGSPNAQRAHRFDGQRISDLQNIQWQVVNYWQYKNKLPNKLADLRDNISGYAPPLDPLTDSDYEYAIQGPLKFELCATFQTSGNATDPSFNDKISRPIASMGVANPFTPADQANWDHGVGRTCFSRTIDPELYKPVKVPPSN